ncbi:uracil-DNA glycosylase [Evansella tamaricis]|uniref:Uracil-DNA glycosylase n=1 Tax=Evansella tamaricis TaxID=2069301 RepID=A0ABS6JBR2_9BACI|nr:uracil-DNA glycosylase [Evansella tamaricis]
MLPKIKTDWEELLMKEREKPYFLQLQQFLKEEYGQTVVYPNRENIFHALNTTTYESTKVVILGQDPYHGKGQAHGLSFSVQPEVKTPPSLNNIYKELQDDLGFPIPNHGYLMKWAKEGVLLLNTVLTVRGGDAYSHQKAGWEQFTDRVISLLNKKKEPVVFILWGKHAQGKAFLITNKQHLIIRSPHPSPLSAHRGFFGSRPFSKTNAFLQEQGLGEVDWEIPLNNDLKR